MGPLRLQFFLFMVLLLLGGGVFVFLLFGGFGGGGFMLNLLEPADWHREWACNHDLSALPVADTPKTTARCQQVSSNSNVGCSIRTEQTLDPGR